jgi:predicted nucleic acid-binding protein
LLSLLGGSAFGTVISVPLVLEYEAVLKQQASAMGLSRADVDDFLDFVCQVSEQHEIHFLWRPTLQDPRDEFVLELAVESRSDFIVTHNARHFVGADRFGVEVVTPKRFFRLIGAAR